MTCPESTGSCTVSPDGACIAPKVSGVFNPPVDVFLQGVDGGVNVSWVTPTDGSTIYNCMSKKSIGGKFIDREMVDVITDAFSTGVIYDLDDVILIFIRPETDTEYGDWYVYSAIANSDWNSNVESVLYNGEQITFNGDIVTYTQT